MVDAVNKVSFFINQIKTGTHRILTAHFGGAKIYFKREDMQGVFSFKVRGAYFVIVSKNAASRPEVTASMAASQRGSLPVMPAIMSCSACLRAVKPAMM